MLNWWRLFTGILLQITSQGVNPTLSTNKDSPPTLLPLCNSFIKAQRDAAVCPNIWLLLFQTVVVCAELPLTAWMLLQIATDNQSLSKRRLHLRVLLIPLPNITNPLFNFFSFNMPKLFLFFHL